MQMPAKYGAFICTLGRAIRMIAAPEIYGWSALDGFSTSSCCIEYVETLAGLRIRSCWGGWRHLRESRVFGFYTAPALSIDWGCWDE
jgi:hypothetical protein